MYVQLIKVFINPELLKKLHIKPMEIPKSKKKKVIGPMNLCYFVKVL